MFYKTIIGLLVTSSLLVFPQRIVSEELKISQLSLTRQIDYFTTLYGVDNSLVTKVIKCESKGISTAKGDSKGGKYLAYGLFQYHKESFKRHAKIFGEELDYYSSYDQLKLGIWAISKGYGNEWTSYRAIKNGGVYSFYSKLLQKDFTVICT